MYEPPKEKETTIPNEAIFYFLAKDTEFRKRLTYKLLKEKAKI